MSNNYFTPYTDDSSEFSASSMNKPLALFDEALSYLKNIIITVDGSIQTDSISGAFSFTGKMRFLFTNPNVGTLSENTVNSTKYTLALGDCLYVDLNNSNGTEIAITKKNLAAGTAFILPKNRVLVAYRNVVSGEIYMANTLHKITTGAGGPSQERTVKLPAALQVVAGNILCLKADGTYALADNANIATTLDLVMVKSSAVGEAVVIESGLMLLSANFTVGEALYLGTSGTFTQTVPTESGKMVKCIGWAVAQNTIKFRPDSFGIKLI